MTGDAVSAVAECLVRFLPGVNVTVGRVPGDALSGADHVVLLDNGGTTPIIDGLDVMRLELLGYTRESATKLLRQAVSALHHAWEQQHVTEFGSLVTLVTDERPHTERVNGLPFPIDRATATLTIGVRSPRTL